MTRAPWITVSMGWLFLFAATLTAAGLPAATQPPATRPATQTASAPSVTGRARSRLAASHPALATSPVVTTSPANVAAPTGAPAGAEQATGTAKPHPDLAVQPNDVIVFLGDELTEVSRPRNSYQFPTLVESFMTVRYPDVPLRFVNAGWAHDTAERALLRLDRDVFIHHPNVVVVCLGLNDPDYLPLDEEKLDTFRKNLAQIVDRCRQAGARVWLMTPPAVEENRGVRVRVTREGRVSLANLAALHYNRTLGQYAQVIREIAGTTRVGLADWYEASSKGMARLKENADPAGYTRDGLIPLARGHALGAATLLKAWSAEPIRVRFEVGWHRPTVKVISDVANRSEPRLRITAEGVRELQCPDCPLPWPMSTGRFESLGPDWLAADMCRFDLHIADPPARGVVITRIDAGGREVAPSVLSAAELKSGINLATLPLLQSLDAVQQIYSDIGTKNLYHYTVWRRLKPEPPQEPELAEAHQKLIDTWLAYEAGYEKLIRKRPKRTDLHLRMKENVKTEQLPTSQPGRLPTVIVRPPPLAPASASTQSAPAP